MISIIVPCYNEGQALPFFYPELKKVLTALGEHEIIFVNDGSNDDTLGAIKHFANEDS